MTPANRDIRIQRATRAGYIAIILLSTLAQLHFEPDAAAAARRLQRAVHPSLHPRDVVDGLRNIALYAGLGAVWVLTSPLGGVRRASWVATLVGAATSVMVETLQLYSPVRTASVLDVLTNTGGAWVGAVAAALLLSAIRSARSRGSYLFGVPLFLVAGAYLAAVLCEAITPLFRQDTVPDPGGGIAERIRFGIAIARSPNWTAMPRLDLVLFFPAGFLCVLALMEMDWSRSNWSRSIGWVLVALGGAFLVLGAEVVHGAAHEMVRYEAVLSHAIAIAAGAAAGRLAFASLAGRTSERRRAAGLLGAYAVVLALWAWRPFVPDVRSARMLEQLTSEHLIPLASLSGRVDLFSVAHIVNQFLLYLPLGSLLAVRPWRTRGALGHLLPGVYLVLLLEAGHIVLAGRWFDVTNVLIHLAGVGVGWVIVRRAGYRPADATPDSTRAVSGVGTTAR